MKRITLFFLLLVSQIIFAQFTAQDVKFFVGSGDQAAYLVVDFKDGTEDRSYAWGYRFNAADEPTMLDILTAVQTAEPAFTIDQTGGFLNDIYYNSHSAEGANPDWWSTWQGESSTTFAMNGGIGSDVEDGLWFGCSYGFSNPTSQAPATPIAAYSSLWLDPATITSTVGIGTKSIMVIVDFGTETDGIADSYATNLLYEGEMTAELALQTLQSNTSTFQFELTENEVTQVNYQTTSASNTADLQWKMFGGTNLSNWKSIAITTAVIPENTLLGLRFGNIRPITPQNANVALLGTETFTASNFSIYPNPASSTLSIFSNEIFETVSVYNMMGAEVISTTGNSVNVENLASGVYILKLSNNSQSVTKRFIKK